MEEIYCPVWWRSSLEDVEDTIKLVKRGTVSVIAHSAGGRPIYKIEYGKSNVKLGRANCSSALGGRNYSAYADKTGEDYNPTVLIDGCIHGGEFEGTVAILNLIKEIETGEDYNGDKHPALMELISRIHLILIPVSNPDGRARIPFRSFIGRTFNDLRYYNQGTWRENGELCGWPGCKLVHPIKEASDFLGAYFNDDGLNMMHEDYFGKISNETACLFDIARYDAPDFMLLLHGGTNATSCILPPDFTNEGSLREADELAHNVKAVCDSEGLRYAFAKPYSVVGSAFCLPAAMHHLCGGVAFTVESNQGLVGAPVGAPDTAEDIYKIHLILFEQTCLYVLKKYNKI